jgi:hypothetical protein
MFGQPITETGPLMTRKNNQIWLTNTKSLASADRLTATKERFFHINHSGVVRTDSTSFAPLIIVNGVPLSFPDSFSEQSLVEITTLLNNKTVGDVTIIEKEPDGWLFHRPFTGVIIILLNDKKAIRKLSKLMKRK